MLQQDGKNRTFDPRPEVKGQQSGVGVCHANGELEQPKMTAPEELASGSNRLDQEMDGRSCPRSDPTAIARAVLWLLPFSSNS